MPPRPSRPPTLPALIPQDYWFTIPDLCFLLGVCPNTIRNHLKRVPNQHKCLVTRRSDGSRTTRFWRVSPTGKKLIGHSTGQAPYW